MSGEQRDSNPPAPLTRVVRHQSTVIFRRIIGHRSRALRKVPASSLAGLLPLARPSFSSADATSAPPCPCAAAVVRDASAFSVRSLLSPSSFSRLRVFYRWIVDIISGCGTLGGRGAAEQRTFLHDLQEIWIAAESGAEMWGSNRYRYPTVFSPDVPGVGLSHTWVPIPLSPPPPEGKRSDINGLHQASLHPDGHQDVTSSSSSCSSSTGSEADCPAISMI